MVIFEELLKENPYLYPTNYCFGFYWSRKNIETSWCDQCGEINGSYDGIDFITLFKQEIYDVIDSVVYKVVKTHKELLEGHLYETNLGYKMYDDELDKDVEELLMKEILDEHNLIQFCVDDDKHDVFMEDLPRELIVEVLYEVIK